MSRLLSFQERVEWKTEARSSSIARPHTPFQANGCFLDQRFPHRITHSHTQLVWTLAQETANKITRVDPSPSGRRPDLTAKGKNELVALFSRKSGVENRGEVKQRFTSAYTIPSQRMFSRSTVSTPHRTQPHPTRLDTCAGNCQVDPSPSGRRPDLTAKGKNELVALFSRKSGVENRGEVKQRFTSAYTIPSQRMFSRSTVSTPHRTQPHPTRLDTCAGNCQ
ncbi:hypothetical protein J3Q64DRAFT_1693170 [Phycomyces blakesleeanus]|uniref:Homeodomain-like DNA binding domain-containing transcription factor n=1 Tax=Phycomyces blakesleeanus TaxID=4837 RepID=A0ABR3BD08_PHYBL